LDGVLSFNAGFANGFVITTTDRNHQGGNLAATVPPRQLTLALAPSLEALTTSREAKERLYFQRPGPERL
jgi:hypothetical protein